MTTPDTEHDSQVEESPEESASQAMEKEEAAEAKAEREAAVEELAEVTAPAAPPVDVEQFVSEVLLLQAPEAEAALAALAAERGADAAPALAAVAQSGQASMPLALKAMDVLVSMHSQAAADALAAIGASRDDPQKAKEARRALHKLSLAGIKAAPIPTAPHAEPEPDKVYASLASAVDGAGSRSVTVVRQNRFGTLRLGVFLLNETLGVTEAYGSDPCSMSLWKRYLAESNENEQKLAPVELAFAREQIEIAAARNERAHTPLPERYWYFRSLAAGEFELRKRPPELAPESIQANPDLLAKSADLLSLPECKTWLFDPDDVRPHVLKLIAEARRRQKDKGSNDLPILDLGEVQQEGAIVSMAINALFDGARRATFQSRLEYTSDILWRTDRIEQAQWAMAAALALGQDSSMPVDQHPFVRQMMAQSLKEALEIEVATGGSALEGTTEEAEGSESKLVTPEEYVDEQGLIRRKSGLILPR